MGVVEPYAGDAEIILTKQEQRSKDKLQEFIKDHPILKQQEKFERMEKALVQILIIAETNEAFMKIRETKAINGIAREALKEE